MNLSLPPGVVRVVSKVARRLLGAPEFGVLWLLLAIFHADVAPAGCHGLSRPIWSDEGDIRVSLPIAAFFVNDGDFSAASDEVFGFEFAFLGGCQCAAEPLAEELRKGSFFVERWREIAAPDAIGRSIIAKEWRLEDEPEVVLRAVGGFDGF